MDVARWKRVDSLLKSAISRPPQEREAYVVSQCSGDEELEREVRSLLDSHKEAGEFLETPILGTPCLNVPMMERAARSTAQQTETLGGQAFIGATFSHYQVIEQLGTGGMGVVWKARDTRLNRFVALKFLASTVVSDPERKRRFIQEARTASALNHPNIVTIYEIEQAGPGGSDFIAMEYLPGRTVGQLIRRKGLGLKDALHFAIQIADALAAAHAAGIVHRDLKPGNVMVSESGSVKVLDFGLAKLAGHGESGELAAGQTSEMLKTEQGVIVGTASYMSPEQAEGKKVDARSDTFSFGAMLYEMVTGRRAFAGDSIVSILSAILRDEPRAASEIVEGSPRELDRIIARCLQKDPNRRYQHAGDLRIDLEQVNESLAVDGDLHREETGRRSRPTHWWWLAAMAACGVVSFTAGLRLHGPEAAGPEFKMTRLTNDAGYSHSPALSRDGKLLAYSSDRGGEGQFDLFVQQVAGGQPIRLTTDGGGNTSPDFSPDGSKIVFESNRDGGGICEIPSFGGQIRRLARDGRNPKYSPDGSQVAFWIGNSTVSSGVPGSGTIWALRVAGGAPRRLGADLGSARFPLWSPDGKHLLVLGYASAKAYETAAIDWWVLDISGGAPVKGGFYAAIIKALPAAALGPSLTDIPTPRCWSADGAAVFSASEGDAVSLWDIGLSTQTGRVNRPPKRLTTNAGLSVEPACTASGALAFTSREARTDIWSLPFNLDRGMPQGAPERITPGPASRYYVSFSRDERYMAFASDQGGRSNIWVRELATGKELSVAGSSFVQRYPVSNASGDRIAFSQHENGGRAVYVASPGGVPEKMCDECLRATDWSRDEKNLLIFGGAPYAIDLLDISSRGRTLLLRDPKQSLLFARYSPDNRWVSFTMRIDAGRARIMIAPMNGPRPVPQTAWIGIAEVGIEDWAEWSPDGTRLYFTSNRDGNACVWGQRLDARSHQPVGEPFAVWHVHGRASYQQQGWSAVAHRVAMVLNENTGNIWMMSRSAGK